MVRCLPGCTCFHVAVWCCLQVWINGINICTLNRQQVWWRLGFYCGTPIYAREIYQFRQDNEVTVCGTRPVSFFFWPQNGLRILPIKLSMSRPSLFGTSLSWSKISRILYRLDALADHKQLSLANLHWPFLFDPNKSSAISHSPRPTTGPSKMAEHMAHTHAPSCDQQSIVTVLSPHVLVYLGMYTVYINIHHTDRIFHEINHPAIGVPPYVYSISGRKLRFFSPDHSTVLAMSGRSTCQELMAWDKLQTSPSSA
jgi:hypothetical protein